MAKVREYCTAPENIRSTRDSHDVLAWNALRYAADDEHPDVAEHRAALGIIAVRRDGERVHYVMTIPETYRHALALARARGADPRGAGAGGIRSLSILASALQ